MNLPNMKEAKVRTKSKKDFINFDFDNIKKQVDNKTYFVKTYGCQMNEHDGERIKAILEKLGYIENKIMENADIVILNTCAIRENAHNKVFGMLGRLKHEKEERDLIIGLCGCMPQEEDVVNEILNKHKHIDLVFGTHNINELPELLNNLNKQEISVYSYEGDVVEGIGSKRESNIKAWVDIIYGCDKFCTYCIVPYTRGAERSRKKEDIINEIKELKEKGYKEVTLLGQNVNAYAKDLYDDYTFSDLLKDVSDTGIERIRFVTSHPWDFTNEMIDIISKRDNLMPYIHLPVQSGSNKILKLMGRKYTREKYLELFNKIKSKIKDVAITTDIIVGFPGETEEDFDETIKLVEECKFDGAFTFIFSPRKNTPAALMVDNIPLKEKEDRLQKLNKIVNKYYLENNKKYLDKTVKVLIEGKSKKDKNMLMGYTEQMKLVNVKGEKSDIGNIIEVKITSAKSFSLDGEKLNI